MKTESVVVLSLLVLAFFYWAFGWRKVKQGWQAVVFTLGRAQKKAKGPGLFHIWPGIERWVKVEIREIAIDIPPAVAYTKDDDPIRLEVDLIISGKITQPVWSVTKVQNLADLVWRYASSAVVAIVAEIEEKEASSPEAIVKISQAVTQLLGTVTSDWGFTPTAARPQQIRRPQEIDEARHQVIARKLQAQAETEAFKIEYEAQGPLYPLKELFDAMVSAAQAGGNVISWSGQEFENLLKMVAAKTVTKQREGEGDGNDNGK